MADPLERVRRFGEAYVRFGLTHPDEYRLVFLAAYIPEAIRKVGHRAPTDDPTKPGVGGALVFQAPGRDPVELEASGTKLNYPPDTCGELCWMGLHGLVTAFILKPEFPWSDRELLIKGMLEIHLKGILRTVTGSADLWRARGACAARGPRSRTIKRSAGRGRRGWPRDPCSFRRRPSCAPRRRGP